MKKLSLICAVLLLSACGGGKSSYNFPPPPVAPPTTPPMAMIDAFYTLVTSYLTPTSEDTDSTPLADSIVGTQPEDTEPTEFS